jgi:hypothetical protein
MLAQAKADAFNVPTFTLFPDPQQAGCSGKRGIIEKSEPYIPSDTSQVRRGQGLKGKQGARVSFVRIAPDTASAAIVFL